MPTNVQVHAVNQSPTQPTSWSPFGPATPLLVIHDYSNFATMFTAFQNGQVDITDWPIQAPDLNTFCPNADIWCSSPQPEFGIFQADINNHAPFLGQIMETSRPALVGSVTTTSSSAGCAIGFGQMTLNVVNIENNTQPFKDSLNTITISNQPSGSPNATVSDSGGSSPTGTYKFPCTLAGTYLLSSTMLTGNATTGSHLGCGASAGCTIPIPSNAAISATWNVAWNSPSTLTPTAPMPNVMKAIAHLVDKPEFVQRDAVLQGRASCDDTMLAPLHLIQGSPCVTALPGQPGSPFPASVLTRECSRLVFDTVITTCSPISAYNLIDDNIGSGAVWWGVPGRTAVGSVATGYSGPADIDAACQYLQLAGFSLTPSGSTCAQLAQATVGTIQPVTYPHFTAPPGTHFVVLLRTDPPRGHFGQIIADSINMLFGTPNDSGSCPAPCGQTSSGTATVLYYNSGAGLQSTATYDTSRVAVPIVLGDGGAGIADRWNMYTGGISLGSTPDSLFSNYHSQFSSSDCGGAANLFPSNYDFHCDPAYDAITHAGEFQAALSGSALVFQEAALRAYDVPIGVAMYSRIQQFAELNGWNWQSTGNGLSSSLVVQKGHGTQTGFWSLLNARQLPGYTPANPIYAPGGGNPNVIRRGFSQDPDTVNPYQATTVWDFEIINQVFDTLLRVNPETAGANQQVIDWMTTSHNESFSPSELGCIAGPSVAATSCFKGITTQTWHLRGDIFFHDGTPVTAQDVVYSILTQRDDPSANGFPSVSFVTNAVALNAKTVQVKLESNSAYHELNIGSVPIVPQHLFQGPGGSICGSISSMSTPAGLVNVVANGPSSACADPAFDPLTCTGTAGLVAGCGTTFADGSFQGIFVGSGPYVCNNVGPNTSQASGKVGGSCIQSSTGLLIGGTSMSTDSRVLLSADFNYMRVIGGPGNFWQKFSWVDVTNDGVVDILDAANMAFFFDSTNVYWTHPRYSCFGSVDLCVASALAILFDAVITPPYPSSQLLNLDPQMDRYNMQLSGSNVCLYYQTTNTAATRLALTNCGGGGAASLPAGHTITGSAVVLNPDGSLGTVQSGSVSISAGAVTNSWSPSLVSGSHYLVRFFDNGVQIGLFYAIP